MGTYDDLAIGETFVTPPRTLSPKDVATLVEVGGYTHPLFTDPAFAASSPFGRSPVPGPGVLLVMGGLVEQTGRFDGTTIGLVGFDAIRFVAPAFAGDRVSVEIEVLAKEPSSSGRRGVLVMDWQCSNERGEMIVEATARMLFRRD